MRKKLRSYQINNPIVEAKLVQTNDFNEANRIKKEAAEKLSEAYYLIADLVFYSDDIVFEEIAQKVLDTRYELKSIDFE